MFSLGIEGTTLRGKGGNVRFFAWLWVGRKRNYVRGGSMQEIKRADYFYAPALITHTRSSEHWLSQFSQRLDKCGCGLLWRFRQAYPNMWGWRRPTSNAATTWFWQVHIRTGSQQQPTRRCVNAIKQTPNGRWVRIGSSNAWKAKRFSACITHCLIAFGYHLTPSHEKKRTRGEKGRGEKGARGEKP